MSYEKLKAFIADNLTDKKLIIVSNREPYSHKKAGSAIRVDKPAGGLTSALDEVLQAIGGTWVAWGSGTGDRDVTDRNSRVRVPPAKPSYTLKRVWLGDSEVENYYHGYSNRVLWPLCHIALDKVYFRKRYWHDYIKANSAFAASVLEEADEKSLIWIHDYHLCLVPGKLKEARPGLTVAQFWHIPWPDHGVFRICPQSKEIIESLLGNDLLGFQLPLFVKNFTDCVKESLEDAAIDYESSMVSYKGHKTKLEAFPISVDYEKFQALALNTKTFTAVNRLRERYGLTRKFIGLGVDRLEYTKGLIKRLQAIDFFFDRYPRFRGKFTFIQIAVPTRMKEPYISYKALVEGLVRKINKKYSSESWNPIVYRDVKAEHEDLAAYYRAADMAVISSIYDGMNLVAKEFVAAQVDGKGVLLLSEFTGAAEELEGAILVNPYDIEKFSDSIKKSLEMPVREKKSRMKTLQRQVKEKDVYRWIYDVLERVQLISEKRLQRCCYLFENIEKLPRNRIFLFLDYDGTLTPIVSTPEKAVMSEEVRSLIVSLKKTVPVAIISGRALNDLKKRVNIDDMIYAGNHGAEIWDGTRLVKGRRAASGRKIMEQILHDLGASLSQIPGVVIENKGITVSVHFRMVKEHDTGRVMDIFWTIADKYKSSFLVTTGKKVLELRPRGIWNKGDAVKWICKNFGKKRIPVYVGDDTTDEDAFRVIKGKGIGICVGWNAESDYYLKSQEEVKRLLKIIDSFA